MNHATAFIIIILSLTTLLQAAPLTLSVIIDNYNYGEYVTEAVDSILAQTHLPDEIIVVDDGSTDGSQALLKERYTGNPRIQLIFQKNKGQATAFNTGYAASHGDIVCFLDADDRLEPGYLETVLSVFEKNPHTTATICNSHHFGDANFTENPYPAEGDRGYQAIFITAGWPGSAKASSMAYRRWVLEVVFPLPTELIEPLKTYGDIPLIIGGALCGGRTYYIAHPFVQYRIHPKNDSKNNTPDAPLNISIEGVFEKCLSYYREKSYMPKSLSHLAILEFGSNPNPTSLEYLTYRKVLSNDCIIPPIAKRRYIAELELRYQQKTGLPPPPFIWAAKRPTYPLWLSGK